MRRITIAATLLCCATILPAQAGSGDFNLGLDDVHALTFQAPVATVYVGNPAIADITMVDSRHAFVQGKAYGRTNIVALNESGHKIYGSYINVVGGTRDDTVVLNRGVQRVTYTCTSTRCEPTPLPGDGKDSFDAQNSQIAAHQSEATKAAQSGD
jgi:Flp pilus assembly secretin CpaC